MTRIEPPMAPRRAIVLLVVLAFLALFAAVGLSFVFYAESQARAARYASQAESAPRADAPPELLLAFALNQLLFDARDDAAGAGSALRGHSLMRSMWGADYSLSANGTLEPHNNTVPYSGTGRLHRVYPENAPPPLRLQDDFRLINYTYFAADGFARDPERLGYRADLTAPRGPFVGGFNAPYTYPDLNNLFLAAVKADGSLLGPSFHRPWLFGPFDPANPNWTNPQGKYLLLRPRPADHPPMNGRPGFPYPEDVGGDVKNLIGPGGCDSVWLDLDFPVLADPSGRKFKPLFAFLVTDLDNKINVNVHGNVRGLHGAHAGNQGWGPWEVNLNRVLAADPSEWKALFLGDAGPANVPGRYGADGLPTPFPPVPFANFGPRPHFYAAVDFDGRQANGLPTAPPALPSGNACFPTFPPGYDNANLLETTGHPALYNVEGPFGPNGDGDDRRFAPSNMEALLRYGDTGSPALTSELFALCPRNFADDRVRRLVTTTSHDSRRPGVSPWLWQDVPYGNIQRDLRYPSMPDVLAGGGSTAFPNFLATSAMPSRKTYDDFARDGRATDAPLTRVDVNRPLPDYPPVDPSLGQITDYAAFAQAQQARQVLARDILLRLIKATGAYDPARFLPATPPSLPELQTMRWLAQFAVNIVDFTDTDDYSTPFPWGRMIGTPAFAHAYGNEWVFGVELPRVVINEVYGEYVNIPGETGRTADGKGIKATRYLVNLWVELFNPFQTDPSLVGSGDAQLNGGYQLLVTKANKLLLSPSDQSNVLGNPDNTGLPQRYDPNQVLAGVNTFDPPALPASDKPGQGFYVIGPARPVPGVDAWDPGPNFGTMRTPLFQYQFRLGNNPVATPPAPTVLLRRLACPALPWQPDPAFDAPATPYNPYVTVDFQENVPLNRGAGNTGTGLIVPPKPLARRQSVGRVQPYNGLELFRFPQAPRPPLVNQPQHTFFSHNQDAIFSPRRPYDWLVHLDRPLISPMELLHVATCRPSQLTHMFKQKTSDTYRPFNHAPYWLISDKASPLHRVFEFLETGCRSGGAEYQGRVPGKINLNTVWDPDVFLALCDPRPSNGFDEADVRQIYQWMIAGRTPGGAPGPNDLPFKALASAQFLPAPAGGMYADAGGINDTLLRDNPKHPKYDPAKRPIRLFEIVKKDLVAGAIQDHPYQRFELLTKMFNNVTTRSHVFAVWMTVGFFEVNDDSTRPVKLGAEMGRAEGRHVRHRMFAIVDRSAAVPLFPAAGQPPITATGPVPPGPATVVPSMMRDPAASNGNSTWHIDAGMILRVTGLDVDGMLVSEDVVVASTTPTSFTATFSRAYPSGLASITAYGNPGPQSNGFHPADHPELVPFFSVIN